MRNPTTLHKPLMSLARQLIEAFALIPTFITFSGVIQKDKGPNSLELVINDSAKHGLLGVILTTSVLKSVEEFETKIPAESKTNRMVRICEPACKSLVITYALGLDGLMKKMDKEQHPLLLYPAFGSFFLIMGRRALVAFQEGSKWTGNLLAIAALSNIVAAIGVYKEDEQMSMISLLCGAGACAGLFAIQAKTILLTPRPQGEAIPLLEFTSP